MKRLVTALAALACSATFLYAVPADPTPRKVKQADGSWITVCKVGDEHGSVLQTTDGYPLFYNKQTGNFEYASKQHPLTAGSGIVAADEGMRDVATQNFLANFDKTAVYGNAIKMYAPRKARRNVQRIRINDYPTIGQHKALVILVEFSDRGFTTVDGDPYGYYNGMLNEKGFTYKNGAHGSARDYYDVCSSGKFAPEFDVIGPVTLPRETSYYGGNEIRTVNGQQYLYTDVNMPDFVKDACEAADPMVDFSQYDENHDGMVDNIYFFYAGYGEADTNRDDVIWPHAANLDSDWGTELQLDGVKINRYACSNEIRGGSSPLVPVGIGTFVHEFAHVLGLADHYDTSYASGRTGISDWDVMAAASYNDNQNTPPAFSAFERAELGWLDYTDIEPTAPGLFDVPGLIGSDKAYRIVVPNTDGREYFIFENRTDESWDTTLPAHGLLAWHIDMDDDAWMNNTVNTDPYHQHIDLVEADGTENSTSYSGDVFPGRGNVTSFDFYDWSGTNLFSFDYVENGDSTVNFLLARTSYKPEVPVTAVENVMGRELTMAVNLGDDAHWGNVSVYTISQDGTRQYVEGYENARFEQSDTVTVTGLEPLTAYTVEAVAGIGSYTSDATVLQVTTTEVQFAETRPEVTGATNVTNEGFTANWMPLQGADSYKVSLYSKTFADEETMSCGFDGRQLPDGWTSSSTSFSSAMFGEKSPSLQMNNDNDWLQMGVDGAKLTSLEFWYRSQTNENIIHVEQFKDGQWNEVAAFATNPITSTYVIDLDSCDEVRITLERQGGYVLVDDVNLGYTEVLNELLPAFADVDTDGKTSFTFSGLDSGATYIYKVRGTQGGNTSRESDGVEVTLGTSTGISSPAVNMPDDGKVEIYDLSGRRLSSAPQRGIYIIKRGGKAVKHMQNIY